MYGHDYRYQDGPDWDAEAEEQALLAEQTQSVCNDIEGERFRQRQAHGNEHDDEHTPEMWLAILDSRKGKVADAVIAASWNRDEYRRQLVKLAAVAVAAIEAVDRADMREATALDEAAEADMNRMSADDIPF